MANIYKVFSAATSVAALALMLTIPVNANADNDNPNDFYVVSPELTNGQHLEKFKMHITRNRIWRSASQAAGDGSDNTDYLELNFKYDELLGDGVDKNTQIHWWIENGDKSKVYYADWLTDNTDFNLGYTATTSKTKDYNLGLNATWDYYGCKNVNTTSPTKNRFYFTIGDDKSFTFVLDKAGSDKNVGFIHNRSIQETTGTPDNTNGFNDGSGYYLIADLKQAITGYVEMKPYEGNDWKTEMTKYYYKDLVAYTADQWTAAGLSTPDSVVYRVHVDKPAGGWNYLYINIMSKGLDEAWSASTWQDKSAGWNFVIRPQVWPFPVFSNKDQDGVDSRSISGGLTQYNDIDHILCHNQSLNPNMDEVAKAMGMNSKDDIGSYDFSMNVTTSTYRLVFNKPKALDLRDYSDVYYKSETSNRQVNGIGAYKYFTCYSDHVAYVKPSDIDAFTVTKYEIKDGKAVVTLHKLTNTKDANGADVLPNDVGLILAVETPTNGTVNDFTPSATTTNFRTVTYNLEEAASQHVNLGDGDNAASLLTPQVEAINLPQEILDADGNVAAYNYLFSFYKHSKWSKDGNDETTDGKTIFDLGFWLTKGAATATYANDAYLRLTKEQVGKFRVGTSYDMTDTYPTTQAKDVPALFVNFDNVDNNGTTGISEINANAQAAHDGAYYTLQGVRVQHPTAAGIYIHNGKKVVFK